jgi:hypothetical protein
MKNYNTECHKTIIAGFEIKIEQSRKKGRLFTVTYGAQVKENLTYEEACKNYGSCIFHALSLDYKIDNSGY